MVHTNQGYCSIGPLKKYAGAVEFKSAKDVQVPPAVLLTPIYGTGTNSNDYITFYFVT